MKKPIYHFLKSNSKRIYLIFLLSLCTNVVNAQSVTWAFLKGFKDTTKTAVYGTMGVADPANLPGARHSSATWQIGSKLYLFGGGAINGNSGYFNDMWEYDTDTGNWRWIKGNALTTYQAAVYGTLGEPAEANSPGSRGNSATWVSGGKLYLFGGQTYTSNNTQRLNDLWVFDPATGNWCWIKGGSSLNQNAYYGTFGVAAAPNTPGARHSSVSWESGGKLYLFGGRYNNTSSGSHDLNDLWVFDPATGYWCWIKGSSLTNQSGTYGTQGVAEAANTPGGRFGSVSWEIEGKLYLFGGNNGQSFNDLWEYEVETGHWRWIKGSNLTNQAGTYGTRGTAAANNTPGARYGSESWESGGKLFLFGGFGRAVSNTGTLNDLWEYNPDTGYWRWIKGSNLNGKLGTLGSIEAANQPGARDDAISWKAGGKLYLFGGVGMGLTGRSGLRGDLWSATFVSTSAALTNLTLSDGTLSPDFDSDTTNYSASVSISTPTITLTPTVSDATASVTVNGVAVTSGSASQAISLSGGSNIISTVVTAQDGETTKTYTLTVTKPLSTNANLAALAISSGTLDPAFDAATLSYAASVPFASSSVTVTPTLSEANATIQVQVNSGGYTSLASASASSALALNVGSNTIDVKVTAQDGTTIKKYTITVSRDKADQVITFNALSAKKYGDAAFDLTATGGASTAVISYSSSNSDVATISGNTVSIVGVGTTDITVSQGADANYNAATPVVQTLIVTKANQTISFSALPAKTFGDAAFNLTATSGASGNAITYASSNTAVATISGNTVSIVGAGTTNITASQAANTNYIAATDVVQELTVSKASQTITFAALPVKAFGDAAFNLTATGGASGNAVTYASSNTAVATISGNTVTIVGAGTTDITASQAANANYNAATDVIQSLTVAKAAQTITFAALPAKTYGDPAFSLTSSGGASGNAVNYVSSNTAVATVNGSTVTIIGAGITNITASQAGNANFNAAADVVQTLTVLSTAELSGLTISSGTLSPAFSSAATNYSVSVGNNISSIRLTPTVSDATMSVRIMGTPVNSGDASVPIALNAGLNTIEISVSSQSGAAKTYTLAVTRTAQLSAVAELASLSLSSGTLSPTFASGTYSYTAAVSNTVSALSLTPVATQAGSTVKVNGATVNSGSSSANVILSIGNNTIVTTVTAQDGTAVRTYTVNIIRAAPTQEIASTSGDVTLNNTTPQLLITSSTQPVSVSVTNGTTNPTVDYGVLISAGGGTLPETSISSSVAMLNIPASTVVSSSGAIWNGILSAPAISTYDLPTPVGEISNTGLIIEIGSRESSLSFGRGVRLLLPGQGGMRLAREHAGVLTEITTVGPSDTQAAGDALPANGSFKINAGNDLVIWTKAFSRFITFTRTIDPDLANVASDKLALTEDLIKGGNSSLAEITGPLTNPLPSLGSNGSAITWVSDKPGVVSDNGQIVMRPEIQSGNATVNLSATIKKGRITSTQLFTLKVLAQPNQAPTLDPIANQVLCYTPNPANILLSGITPGPETYQAYTIDIKSNNDSLFNDLKITQGSTGTGILSYMLKPGAVGNAMVTVTVKDNGGVANGGKDTFVRSFSIIVNALPAIQISTSASDLSKGNTAVITASGGTSYSWATAAGIISGQNSAVLTVRPAVSTSYTVSVTNASGCTTSQSITINVRDDYEALDAMNIMTPNGDGVNDFLIIKNLDMYPNNTLRVFDRAGRQIYIEQNYANKWAGTFNGSSLAEGTYYYFLDFDNGKRKIKGFVSIAH